MISAEAILVFCRFAYDLAALFLFGASIFVGFLAPASIREELWLRLCSWRRIAVVSLIIAVAPVPWLRAATFGEGWSDVFSGQLVSAILFETNLGLAWMIQAMAAVGVLLLLACRSTVLSALGTAAVASVFVVTLSLTGHAVMNDGWLGRVHQVNNALHALAAGLWVGALPPVLAILRKLDNVSRPDALKALMRFSTLGHLAVALVLLTGVANTLLVLERLPLHMASPYERMLATKVALVLTMVGLALVNRYILVPRMRRRPDASQALLLGTIAEMLLAPLVLGLVAWFGMMDPH